MILQDNLKKKLRLEQGPVDLYILFPIVYGTEGGSLFKIIIPEIFPNLGRDYGYPGTGRSNSKQDQPKEHHSKAHYNVKSKR